MPKTTSSNSSKSKLPFLEQDKHGILIRLYIQPRASKNEITDVMPLAHGKDGLKIRLTSPPVEGAANAACIEFLADMLGIRKNQIEIASGQKSRIKQVRITGGSLEEIKTRLLKSLP